MILAWAKKETHVRALFWYGSYSVKKEKADSDLDVAVLFEPHITPSGTWFYRFIMVVNQRKWLPSVAIGNYPSEVPALLPTMFF